ncbi:MAG: malonate transporter subunit MadM, partial [Planctomycetaceae bacterium]
EVIALSVAAGLVKAVAVMLITPLIAPVIRLNTPRAAMIFGGLQGTNSGVIAGLAAANPKLVPYGAMTATFYTGLGCLLGPSLFFLIIRKILTSEL